MEQEIILEVIKHLAGKHDQKKHATDEKRFPGREIAGGLITATSLAINGYKFYQIYKNGSANENLNNLSSGIGAVSLIGMNLIPTGGMFATIAGLQKELVDPQKHNISRKINGINIKGAKPEDIAKISNSIENMPDFAQKWTAKHGVQVLGSANTMAHTTMGFAIPDKTKNIWVNTGVSSMWTGQTRGDIITHETAHNAWKNASNQAKFNFGKTVPALKRLGMNLTYPGARNRIMGAKDEIFAFTTTTITQGPKQWAKLSGKQQKALRTIYKETGLNLPKDYTDKVEKAEENYLPEYIVVKDKDNNRLYIPLVIMDETVEKQ